MADSITPARTPEDIPTITTPFHAYAASLGIDLSFQSFSAELASLPGKYAPPHGALLLARATTTNNNEGQVLGCVALRPLPGHEGICEMKRLYVSPSGREKGIGKGLAAAVVEEARRVGFKAMRLDTLPSMASAIALYKALGFVEIEAYYATPIEGTVFPGIVVEVELEQVKLDSMGEPYSILATRAGNDPEMHQQQKPTSSPSEDKICPRSLS